MRDDDWEFIGLLVIICFIVLAVAVVWKMVT